MGRRTSDYSAIANTRDASRTFQARTYTEALKLVKAQLGPDALIVSCGRLEDGATLSRQTGWIEVRALPAESLASSPVAFPVKGVTMPRVSALRPSHLRPLARQLLDQEVGEKLVDGVMESVSRQLDEKTAQDSGRVLSLVISELMARVNTLADDRRHRCSRGVCFVGGEGVGKTTMVAKLAVDAARQGKRVAALALHEREGNHMLQQLTAPHLEGQIFDAPTPQTLVAMWNQLSHFDCVFLDAPGVSPFDEKGIARLYELLRVIPGLEVHLVLRASHRDMDLYRTIERFMRVNVQALAFTFLDEACCYGGVMNASERAALPLSYFGFGREIPADIEPASRERVVDLLMDISAR